ncbi:unnamed protein product [Caenorhabditis auriculariae]|uniref:Uncharacterized protein n=1 Tax=Caenorhabditis auriculariae TaxID=2777116 RepID=A0A8S1HQ83_9PELO|nr:unnamed protein product [Caenorhabditis auriculariae]
MFALQVHVCDLGRPVILAPALGFESHGILNDFLSPFNQFYIALVILGAVEVSTTALFEYRHHALLPPGCPIKFSYRSRVVIFIIRALLGCNLGTVWQFMKKDLNVARRDWEKILPCELAELQDDESTVFFFSADVAKRGLTVVCFCAGVPIFEMIFYVFDSFRKAFVFRILIYKQNELGIPEWSLKG